MPTSFDKYEVPPFGVSILEANVDITTCLSRVDIRNNQANITTNRQNLESLTDAHRDSILRFHAEGPGLEKRSNLVKVIPLFSYLRSS